MEYCKINEKIFKLWKEFNNDLEKQFQKLDIKNYIPYFFTEEFQDPPDILFIGCNPSITDKTIGDNSFSDYYFENFKNEEKITDTKNKTFYKIQEQDKKLASELMYFKKIKEVSDYVSPNCNWQHIDLLYIRCTKQKNVEQLIHDENLKKFISEQQKITMEVIKKIKPKIIVVINALASKLFKEINNDYIKFNEKSGYYDFNYEEEFSCSCFFSSMLSGQRALDNESLLRLKWHIKKCYNKKLKNSSCNKLPSLINDTVCKFYKTTTSLPFHPNARCLCCLQCKQCEFL